jgi:hypothetical protein
MAPEKDEAVAEAKHCIDRLLSRLKQPAANERV